MPRTRKDEAPILLDEPEIEGRYAELGDWTVSYETYRADADPAPLFRGLPGDRCQFPRWGYVVRGRVGFRFADRVETYAAGDAYYVPPGHTPIHYAGAEIVEFSPTDQLGEAIGVAMANLQTLGATRGEPRVTGSEPRVTGSEPR